MAANCQREPLRRPMVSNRVWHAVCRVDPSACSSAVWWPGMVWKFTLRHSRTRGGGRTQKQVRAGTQRWLPLQPGERNPTP